MREKTYGQRMKETRELFDDLIVMRKSVLSDKAFIIDKFCKEMQEKIKSIQSLK